jgi:hypothetical protein
MSWKVSFTYVDVCLLKPYLKLSNSQIQRFSDSNFALYHKHAWHIHFAFDNSRRLATTSLAVGHKLLYRLHLTLRSQQQMRHAKRLATACTLTSDTSTRTTTPESATDCWTSTLSAQWRADTSQRDFAASSACDTESLKWEPSFPGVGAHDPPFVSFPPSQAPVGHRTVRSILWNTLGSNRF